MYESSRYASTWDALAQRLGVTRRAIQDWRNDERIRGLCPRDRADGRHDVKAWADFMVEFGLKGADEVISTESGAKPIPFAGSVADWKKAEVALKVEQRQIEIQAMKGTLLVATDLELPLGATMVAIQNKLTQFPDRLAPQVVGFTDVQEVIAIIRAEVEADLSDLNVAGYIETGPMEVAQSLPFDEETSSLMDSISFGGQDRAAFNALIGHCARKVIANIGKSAIARVRNHTEPVEELPLNAPYDPDEEEAKPKKRKATK